MSEASARLKFWLAGEVNHNPHLRFDITSLLAELDLKTTALASIAASEGSPPIDYDAYTGCGLYCGVEDRDCRNRYDGALYGYSKGTEGALEWAAGVAQEALGTPVKSETVDA